MNTRGIMNYIEQIRYGRNITQEELLLDIISRRQYIRYRNDESYVPLDIVEKLAKRLGISSKQLMFEYESKEVLQTDKIKKYYNAVVRRDFSTALEIETEIKSEVIINEDSEIYFRLGLLIKDLYEERLAQPEFLRMVAAIINYPEILNQAVITETEAVVMGLIQEYSEPERDLIMKKLESFISNEENYVSGVNYQARIQLIFSVAKYHGRIENYEKVIEICDIGLGICSFHKSYFSLEFLTYYKALALYNLGVEPDYIEPLKKCVTALLLRNEPVQIERFRNYFKKDLNIDFDEFVYSNLIERKSD